LYLSLQIHTASEKDKLQRQKRLEAAVSFGSHHSSHEAQQTL